MIPLNDHIEVKPITVDSFISSSKDLYEEKGTVVALAKGIMGVDVGDVVYFDSWMSAKYEDEQKVTHYFVPFSAVRAYEKL